MNKYTTCPCCCFDITEVVNVRASELEKEYFARLNKAGASLGGKIGGKISGAKNIQKANAMYTPEKRKAAALKAWETKRKKAAENAEK